MLDPAAQIGRIKQSLRPELNGCRLILFAGDHGIAAEGVSAYPQDVTRQMVLNFLAGGAAASVFARTHGVGLAVVDAGVAGEAIAHPDLIQRRIASGTNNFLVGPAMTRAQLLQALRSGRALASNSEAAFPQQPDVLAFGEMGIANTSSAALLGAKLLGQPVEALVGPGTGVAGEALKSKARILSEAAARTPETLPPLDALEQYGGFEVVMMTGAMIGAAQNQRLVLVDGFISTAAALAAIRIAPAVGQYLVFAHASAEPGHAILLDALDARPLLSLEMRLGEGTGALLAWPLVQAAAGMLREMASFDEAGVSGPAG